MCPRFNAHLFEIVHVCCTAHPERSHFERDKFTA